MKFNLLLLLLIAISGNVIACKCDGPGTVRESFKYICYPSWHSDNKEIVSFAETIQPWTWLSIRK